MSAAETTQHGDEPASDAGQADAQRDAAAGPDVLASTLQELSDRIEALQADVRRLGGPGLPPTDPGWESEEPEQVGPSYAWVSSIPAPVRRRRAVPRLLLEVLFLAATATAAAIAELDAAEIAAVMVGSWVLVALIEWAASRADRRRDEIPAIVPLLAADPPPADPAWFVPPVEHTLIETTTETTAVTRLPPAPDDLDATVERPAG